MFLKAAWEVSWLWSLLTHIAFSSHWAHFSVEFSFRHPNQSFSWPRWSAYNWLLLEAPIWVQAVAQTLHQLKSTDPSKTKPRKCLIFFWCHYSQERELQVRNTSAQQGNGAAEDKWAKQMNTGHISATSNNNMYPGALEDLKSQRPGLHLPIKQVPY